MIVRIAVVSLLTLSSVSLSAQTLYLMRHFEKQAAGSDPSLTEQGAARAMALASMLQDQPIAHIFTSDYRRTRSSVAPLAKTLGLAVTLYDPRDLSSLAAQLATLDHVVVAGHSNTTPQLVRLLGGEADDMDELTYGDLFVLTKVDGNTVTQRLKVPAASAVSAALEGGQ